MDRELSENQLKEIYNLCKRKDIRYLELRMELVDHIASQIETLWEDEPELSFQEAFQKVYKSFGIFGLSEIAEEHEKVVAKRFYQKAWLEFKSWLKPPKVLAFITLLLAFFTLMQYYPQSSLGLVQLNMISALGILSYMFFKRRNLRNELAGDQSMLMGSIYQGGIGFYVVFMGPASNFLDFSVDAYINFSKAIHQAFALILSIINILVLTVGLRLLNSAEGQIEELKLRQAFYA